MRDNVLHVFWLSICSLALLEPYTYRPWEYSSIDLDEEDEDAAAEAEEEGDEMEEEEVRLRQIIKC